MRFGVHVSISRGPEKTAGFAVERGCEAVQIFSSNPRGWALSKAGPAEDRMLLDALRAQDIGPILLHTPYLLNIATADEEVFTRSVGSLVHAADRARRLEGYVVVHAGRDRRDDRDRALERAAAAVLTALKLVPDARILIEPTAGGRGAVACRAHDLAELLAAIGHDRVGACLDTCHAHAAGYDLSTAAGATAWLDDVDAQVGLSRVPALHANDSRDPSGSNRDRHWHLGEGTIGEAGFAAILSDPRLKGKAVICETPGDADDDRRNLARARGFAQTESRSTSSAAARSSKSRRK